MDFHLDLSSAVLFNLSPPQARSSVLKDPNPYCRLLKEGWLIWISIWICLLLFSSISSSHPGVVRFAKDPKPLLSSSKRRLTNMDFHLDPSSANYHFNLSHGQISCLERHTSFELLLLYFSSSEFSLGAFSTLGSQHQHNNTLLLCWAHGYIVNSL